MGSLDLLARAPIWGLQLDRAWVTALRSDAVARKVCRAGIGMACRAGYHADRDRRRRSTASADALLALGCPSRQRRPVPGRRS